MDITWEDITWPKTLFEDDGEARQEGLHLTDVIKSLMEDAGMKMYTGDGFRDMELTAEMGLLWERVLSKVMREKFAIRPPQLQKDGIWMSPDGVNFPSVLSLGPDPLQEYATCVEEYKFTWKSTRNAPDQNFYYMAQLKAYCTCLETPAAVQHIFYCNGDYRGSGPVYRRTRVIFTEWELEDNWRMIKQQAEKIMNQKGNQKGKGE